MEIYPAIDLMDGRCVRLTEGSFAQPAVYETEPLQVAMHYRQAGARYLHLVDLDAARDQSCRQHAIIQRLASESGLQIQLGGGIRSADEVASLLSLGICRVILGSLAIKDIAATQALLREFGAERVVLAFDVKAGADSRYYLATHGWQDLSPHSIENHLKMYAGHARHILCTDIHKDGRLEGPNFSLYRYLHNQFPDFAFQASGGVSTLEDLAQLRELGMGGVIIGKALYEGRFTLDAAIGQGERC